MAIRKCLARTLLRTARWLDPKGNYLDALRDYYDNTCMADKIDAAEWVEPTLKHMVTYNFHGHGGGLIRELVRIDDLGGR